MNWFKRALSLLVALVVLMIAVSCTTERDAVDKSPELSLDKRLFEGEFFLRQTIVDLPYTADYAFIGESNDGKVVKWKITENWLVAYSVWDKLNAIDTNDNIDVNETPIVAYPIAMHYDIVPTENPTTGEALPVLVPNTDRPWNERRYFELITNSRSGVSNYELKYLRLTIEWGAPFFKAGLTTATDWEFYAHDGTFIVPKKYREYTATSNDQARFEKEVEWFQFNSVEYFEPINDWSTVYTMEDVEEFVGNEPATVTYRYVFSKVNRDVFGKRDYDVATRSFAWKKGSKDSGFRPLEFTDELFREYGYFTNTFRGYDNYHGYKDDNVHILANHWNIAWANEKKEWNFKCEKNEKYNECLKKVKYQQKTVFVSSPKTPLRMLPVNCAITKDYNYSMLESRYAAMNPGSDTRDFKNWYMANYKNDFFNEVEASDGTKVMARDLYWYLTDLNDTQNPYHDWEERCFVPDSYAWIQRWDGSFIDEMEDGTIDSDMEKILEQYKNDLIVLVKNNVESYVPERDGKALYGFSNYYNYSDTNRENAVRICVNPDEAALYKEDKVMHFETCVANNEEMTKLYVTDSGMPEWRGDRWDCKVYADGEECPEGTVEAKAACVLNAERTCEVEGGLPVLRHQYDNGNPRAALINWVEKPTDYGILGVSQWNVNPETGQSMGGGSNVAGSVLAWATERAVEMARMIIDKEDPAAWDWEDLINPDYEKYPTVKWDNNPGTVGVKSIDGKSDYNTMKMVTKSRASMTQDELLKAVNDDYAKITTKYDRFDNSSIKGSKWESKMVPYSIKKSLFPWSDPSNNPSYSDAEREIMEPWYGGIEMIEAQILRGLEIKARDFDFDESFMDGAIIQFIKEKQAQFRAAIPEWNDGKSGSKEYEAALIYSIYNDLERMMFKGVAQHEMGHTMGLRHNFAGSADADNYGDSFYATRNFPAMMDGVKDLLETEMEKPDYNPATFGIKAYRYKKGFESDLNYFTYTSVMDYQREAYIHSVGLGKYDLAALKFVYGRSFEKVKVNGKTYGPLVKEGEAGDKNGTMNPLRDPAYPDFVRTNEAYLDNKGELIKVKIPTEVQVYYENGEKISMLAPKAKLLLTGTLQFGEDQRYVLDYDCDKSRVECKENLTYLVNDGSHYEYIFVSDEKSRDDPKANTFDGGYLASDIIRQMKDMDNMFYYLRFFRRGNPKFREFRGRNSMKMIMDTLFNQYKYIHFLLDFNFYAYDKWAPYLGIITNGCPSSYEVPTGLEVGESMMVKNHVCDEYQKAIRGQEYWIENGKLRTLTPMGPADHVVAGMEGINHFYFDTLYRPMAGEYWKIKTGMDVDAASKLENLQDYYYQTTENYVGGLRELADAGVFSDIGKEDFIDVPATMGRFQKDRYDIQDNPEVYYDKVLRRGFAEEKMVAIYAITNAGWFDGKYRRESRANAADQMFDGLGNVKFAMLSDIMNEESLFSFSPYCVDTDTNEIVKIDLPVNILTNFAIEPPFKGGTDSASYMPKKNLCSQAGEAGRYVPVHAGWTYFDKMWPMYFAMSNVANTSADTSVFYRFVTYKIPAYEIGLYPEVDVNEVQFKNQDENHYYRASLAASTLDVQDKQGLRIWQECKDGKIKAELDFEDCINDVVFTKDGAIAAGDENIEGTQRFATSAAFGEYLSEKYARYNPAFRLVKSARKLKESEDADMKNGAEGFTRLVIMETTLDQMNLFAYDNLGFAAYYASRY